MTRCIQLISNTRQFLTTCLSLKRIFLSYRFWRACLSEGTWTCGLAMETHWESCTLTPTTTFYVRSVSKESVTSRLAVSLNSILQPCIHLRVYQLGSPKFNDFCSYVILYFLCRFQEKSTSPCSPLTTTRTSMKLTFQRPFSASPAPLGNSTGTPSLRAPPW